MDEDNNTIKLHLEGETEPVAPAVSVSPENLPRIDAVETKADEPKVSPENLPLKKAPDPVEAVEDAGFLPGLDSEAEEVNSGEDMPPEFQTRNNPVFIDTVPVKEEKPAETPEKAVPEAEPAPKAPLVFTEEKPVPMRDGKAVPNYREQLQREINAIRQKRFAPLTMQGVRENDTVGSILLKARQASGYTYSDVGKITRITENFIKLIESDNTSKIPTVYCSAYIQSLCKAYRLSAEVTSHVIELNRTIPVDREETPVEIMQEINSKTRVNEEEERRLNRIFTIFLVVIGVFVILGLWLIVWLVIQHNVKKNVEQDTVRIEQTVAPEETETPAVSTSKLDFDQDNFRPLMPNPSYEMNELEVSPTPSVHKK